MATNTRNREADTILAAKAHRVNGGCYRNYGTKAEPQWVILAPVAEVAAVHAAGAGVITTARGDDSFFVLVGLHELDGAKSWTMYDAQDQAVEVAGIIPERLNVERPRREGAVSYSMEPKANREGRKTVRVDDVDALLAALAAKGVNVSVKGNGNRGVVTSKSAPKGAASVKSAPAPAPAPAQQSTDDAIAALLADA